jgi:hypothetical protein
MRSTVTALDASISFRPRVVTVEPTGASPRTRLPVTMISALLGSSCAASWAIAGTAAIARPQLPIQNAVRKRVMLLPFMLTYSFPAAGCAAFPSNDAQSATGGSIHDVPRPPRSTAMTGAGVCMICLRLRWRGSAPAIVTRNRAPAGTIRETVV